MFNCVDFGNVSKISWRDILNFSNIVITPRAKDNERSSCCMYMMLYCTIAQVIKLCGFSIPFAYCQTTLSLRALIKPRMFFLNFDFSSNFAPIYNCLGILLAGGVFEA